MDRWLLEVRGKWDLLPREFFEDASEAFRTVAERIERVKELVASDGKVREVRLSRHGFGFSFEVVRNDAGMVLMETNTI